MLHPFGGLGAHARQSIILSPASQVQYRGSTILEESQVPFGEKDDAKALGARFDGNRKSWFAPDDYVREAMAVRWQPAANQAPGAAPPLQPQWQPGQYGSAQGASDFKILYDVPFDAKDQAKALGARFDGSARKW